MNRLSLVSSPLTYSMDQSPSWEANQFWASQEISRILWNLKVLYSIHRWPPPFSLDQFHSLFWAYHSWGIKQGLSIVTCKTEDLVVIGLVCAFLEVFLTALYFRVTCCPTFRACTAFLQVPYVPECPAEGLGNMRHLHEWGTSSCGGAIIFRVECITASFFTFFQFGENTQWIMDGFALGRMCTRCVDMDHFCTKAPWV